MMEKAKVTIKAEKATITLGDIEFDVFMLPDGDYVYTYDWLTTVIGKDKKLLSNKQSNYHITKLCKANSEALSINPKVKEEGINKPYNTTTSSQLMTALGTLIELGHTEVISLITACAIEALERRADKAFGVKRSEEERNERLALRAKSKITRRSYTDILKEKLIEQYGEDGYKQMRDAGYFRDVTTRVNLHLFGQPHFKCDRDNMTQEQLTDVELFERQLERRARRYPEHTAEQLMQWMIEQF